MPLLNTDFFLNHTLGSTFLFNNGISISLFKEDRFLPIREEITGLIIQNFFSALGISIYLLLKPVLMCNQAAGDQGNQSLPQLSFLFTLASCLLINKARICDAKPLM